MKFMKLWKNYLNPEEELELHEKIFRQILFGGFIITILSLIQLVIFRHLYIISIPVFALACLLAISMHLVYRYRRLHLATLLVGILYNAFFIPFLYFFEGGLDGGASIYMVLGLFYAATFFSGIEMLLITGGSIVIDFLCYFVSYHYPQYVMYLADAKEVYIDSFIAIIAVALMIAFILRYHLAVYASSREKAVNQKEEVESIAEAKTSFFANMSHEIRTPINTIVGLNEMILREEGLSDETVENALTIQNAAKMLLSLVNDILDLSKVESKKMDILPVSYSTETMISELVSMTRYRIASEGLDYIVDVDPALPSVLYGDDKRISQIMINLLTNAAKYTKEGSVTLKVRFTSENPGFIKLRMVVADTGIGIKSEYLPELFDSFSRADNIENRHIEGTGLGLSICKQLIQLMDGEIKVDSIYKKGSEFSITLEQKVIDSAPIGKLDILSSTLTSVDSYVPLFEAPEARILVVDDNEMNRSVVTKLLRGTKVIVDEACDGASCLELTEKFYYHVILMDYLMPEMNGAEVTRRIRRQSSGLCQNTPIIVLTADLSYCSKQNFNHLGFSDFVEKPFQGKQLEEKIYHLLPQNVIEISNKLSSEVEDQDARIYESQDHFVKRPVTISCDCVSDIPQNFVDQYDISVMYLYIHSRNSRFADTKELQADALSKFNSDVILSSWVEAASIDDYENYFAKLLAESEYVIHFALGSGIGKSYSNAYEAAKCFDHVIVIDSNQLSGGIALQAIEAAKLASNGYSASEIEKEIILLQERIVCQFVLPDSSSFLRNGFASAFHANLLNFIRVRPIAYANRYGIRIRHALGGSVQHVRKRYLRYLIRRKAGDSTELLLLTHASIPYQEMEELRQEAMALLPNLNVIIQKSSVANSCSAGLGSLGIAFLSK